MERTQFQKFVGRRHFANFKGSIIKWTFTGKNSEEVSSWMKNTKDCQSEIEPSDVSIEGFVNPDSNDYYTRNLGLIGGSKFVAKVKKIEKSGSEYDVYTEDGLLAIYLGESSEDVDNPAKDTEVYFRSMNPAKVFVYTGSYRYTNFVIISSGNYPRAYIEVNDEKRKEKIEGEGCHGGITAENGNIFGWDYCHCGDHYLDNSFPYSAEKGQRHEFTDVLKDVQMVIDRITA